MSEGKQQIPSVGRVVHYVSFGSPNGEYPALEHRAAMITEVYLEPESSEVDLTKAGIVVFNPIGLIFRDHAPYDPTAQQPGSWHWPEYVPSR